MATTAPFTLTGGLPTTQNTAPIVEHRCLYSYDLRRKQKRWQDGHLRFHTFNKRVMVYDVPRNYIGDTHWRESELVQDGDEFELDRGVLIQVGEVLGSVEQDLSGLLEKRTKAPEIQVVGEAAAKSNVQRKAVPPAVTALREAESSQILRPKPLNAVLGTPKGRIGRAAFPTKSPYELRIEAENNPQQDDRASKRRRIESPADRRPSKPFYPRPTPTNRRVAKAHCDTSARGDHTARGDPVPENATRKHPYAASTVVGLSKDRACDVHLELEDGGTVRAGIDVTSSDRNGVAAADRQSTKLPRAGEQSSQSKASKKKEAPRSEGFSERAATHCKRPAIREGLTISKLAPSSAEHPTRSLEEPRSQSRLQLIARRPRKKLMYRDLLPQTSAVLNPIEQRIRSKSRAPSHSRVVARSKRTGDISLTSLHQLEQEKLEDRMQRQREKLTSMGHDHSIPINVNTSDEEIISRHHKTRQKSIAPTGEVQSLVNEDKPKEPTLDRTLPKPRLKKHDTDQTLARMDELLGLRTQRAFPEAQNDISHKGTETDAGSVTRQDLDTIPGPEVEPIPSAQAPCGSKTQIASSPEASLQKPHHSFSDPEGTDQAPDINESKPKSAAKPTAEGPMNDEPHTIPSTQDPPNIIDVQPALGSPLFLTPAPNPKPTTTSPPLNEPAPLPAAKPPEFNKSPAPPSHFNVQPGLLSHLPPDPAPMPRGKSKCTLPTFKQPTRRSPRKKAGPQQTGRTATSPGQGTVSNQHARPSSKDGVEQAAEAWSVEAWELFGCGRDGVGCSFAEFNGRGE